MRNSQQDADGVVGRGHLPEHGAPVLPELRALRPAAQARRVRAPPAPASTPTTAGWRTSAAGAPERRAGIGQIFLNDIDDAIEDVRWIKEHNLRGGVLLPTIPPDVDWIKPLNHPDYDRLWAVCEELEVPDQLPRRHRLAGLRPGPVVGAHHARRGARLLPSSARCS